MHCKHRSGLLLALLASCACLWADPPTQPDPRQIVELVNQLGSKLYKDRQSATQALAKLGRLARPALQEAVNHPDPEISVRAKILLPAAVRDDLNYRLERFQADTAGKERHDLPGWDRFVELVGDTPPARKLFAAMLKAQGELIELALREPAQARTQLVILTNQILARPLKHDTNTLHIVQPGEFYAMLFAALAPKVNPPLQASQGLFDLLYKQAILDSLRPTAAEAAPARKLLAAWLREQQAGGLYSSQIVAAIDNLELTEAAAIALALAKNQTLPGRLRAEALVALARVGDKTMLRDIEPLLTDTSEIGSFFLHQSQGQTQLRDVALATLLHLSKSKLSDYEFAVARAGESELFFTPIFLGFDSNESRNTALARWRAYRKSADPRP